MNDATTHDKTPRIVYVTHSGQAFGTERIALATLAALRTCGRPLLVAPAGPAHALAAAQGIESQVFATRAQLLRVLWNELRAPGSLLFTTGLVHTLCATLLRVARPGRFRELHVVHGGTDERLSYGRKHLVASLGVRLVAISKFVRARLMAHGVSQDAIVVVPNFIDPATQAPQAAATPSAQVRRVVVVSRADRIKRLDLLVDAVRSQPALRAIEFDVLGSGEELDTLRRAAADLPNVHFHGYVDDVPRRLADADLLVHTCPQEPFGLAILEAFHAGVPVLVPDTGGAAELVRPGVNGWRYAAGDAAALAEALVALAGTGAPQRQAAAETARQLLRERYSPEAVAPVLWSLA